MTLWLCMRLTIVHLWRVLRAWRLPCAALVFLVLICVNILLSTRTQNVYSRDNNHNNHEMLQGLRRPKPMSLQDHSATAIEEVEEFQGHPKLSLMSGLLKGEYKRGHGEGHQAVSPEPEVKNELSSGVQEEENSAREVLDGDISASNKGAKHIEDNAANEVNSIEPQLGGVNYMNYYDEEAERDFHELPANQVYAFSESDNKADDVRSNWRNLSQIELNRLSTLGRRLYLNENVGTVRNKNFTILVWKTGPSIERRLLKQYGKEKMDPFRKCSVRNCELTYKDAFFGTADAILIHLHRTRGPSTFPNRTNFNQRWIWLTDESPYHTFMVAKNKDLANYNGYFNWSMSYRMDSDIPVPYGRTIEMSEAEASLYKIVDYFRLKSKTVAVMGSNCGGNNKRWDYVKELQKFMEVDVYGKCGSLKCPGHFTEDCKSLDDYKFYLAFENGNCLQYITEKVWWNALGKGSVPVVMGGKIEDYRKILPPDSFIHIDDFRSPHLLAKHLLSLAHNRTKYMGYHAWRSRFRVVNEHGYFASDVFHYCRVCEALNYNDQTPKVYNDMEIFWNKETQCYPPTWQTRMKGTA